MSRVSKSTSTGIKHWGCHERLRGILNFIVSFHFLEEQASVTLCRSQDLWQTHCTCWQERLTTAARHLWCRTFSCSKCQSQTAAKSDRDQGSKRHALGTEAHMTSKVFFNWQYASKGESQSRMARNKLPQLLGSFSSARAESTAKETGTKWSYSHGKRGKCGCLPGAGLVEYRAVLFTRIKNELNNWKTSLITHLLQSSLYAFSFV